MVRLARLRSRRGAVCGAAVVVLASSYALSAGAASATPKAVDAASLMPPAGSVYSGESTASAASYTAAVGKHPAVFGDFVTWGESIHFAFDTAITDSSRLMLHISTAGVDGTSVITPAAIAAGDGDAYLLSLSAEIQQYADPVYIRLLPEMNNANNPYSGFNADGSSRGAAYSPATFKQAWRRVVLILRGGRVSAINTALGALGLAPIQGVAASTVIAQSPIAFVWTPETAGTPNVPQQAAAAYYPGNAYVDWVGTDFYGKFPNFAGLDTFYPQYPGKPFVFAEWALWGSDDPGFVSEFFSWVNAHKRVKMILYNDQGPFALNNYPASTAAIRTALIPPRFLSTTGDPKATFISPF